MNIKLEQIYSKLERKVVTKPIYLQVLGERSFTKKDIKDAIVDNNPKFSFRGDKNSAMRVVPAGYDSQTSRDEINSDFEKTLSQVNLVVRDIKPKGDGASSKFPTYVVADDTGNEFQIVLAGGATSNKGMSYERDVLKSLEEYFAKLKEGTDAEKPKFLAELEDKLDITFAGVVDEVNFNRRVVRPLDTSGARDMGKEIADLALRDDKENTYYVSLKDIGGLTVANTGAAGMFDIENNSVEFVNREKNKIGKKVFEASGINDEGINKIERGLSDYLNKKESEPGQEDIQDTTDTADKEKLKNLLYSAFDYGYIYVKRKSTGIDVVDLSTQESLKDFIGDIVSVKVKYPYYRDSGRVSKRKNISIVIETENNTFSFDIRDASGGIVPKQINLVKLKSKKETKVDASNVDAIASSDQDLDTTLQKYFS